VIAAFRAGFYGAFKLFVGTAFLLLIIPPTAIGLVAGIIWNAAAVGFRSEKELLEWLVGDGAAWRISIKLNDKDKTP
jgi:hypothetical protein